MNKVMVGEHSYAFVKWPWLGVVGYLNESSWDEVGEASRSHNRKVLKQC